MTLDEWLLRHIADAASFVGVYRRSIAEDGYPPDRTPAEWNHWLARDVEFARDYECFEQGRLRAISALTHKPENVPPNEWLAAKGNIPTDAGEHPDFVAGYLSIQAILS